MKIIVLVSMLFGLATFYANSQDFYLDENGVTIKCENCHQGDTGTVNGILYEAVDRELLEQRRDEGADLKVLCTSLVTKMDGLFAGMEDFNQDIGSWDVSGVTDMSRMFYLDTAFNQDIGSWDVSNVTDMSSMFAGDDRPRLPPIPYPSNFNMDISSWDVSKVTDMSNMFNISNFNKPVGSWNVSNVTNMSSMFAGICHDEGWLNFTSPFDQNIGSWDVSNVEDMSGMFYMSNFNNDIGDWNVGNVTDMSWMFCLAVLFNQDIGDWNVSNVTNMDIMFVWACNFNQDLSGWCVQKIESPPEDFNSYCSLRRGYYPVWGTCPTLFYSNEKSNMDINHIYPNPANKLLTIETSILDHYNIRITDINGQLVHSKEIDGIVYNLDISSFPNGIYIITIRSKDCVATRKIIKL